MAGKTALAVASAALSAASDAIVDHTTLAVWAAISVVAGAIGGIAVFTKNILEIRKLKADALRRDAEEREVRLRQAKMELEIEKLLQDAQERDAARSRQAEADRQIIIASHAERVRFGLPTQVGREWPSSEFPQACARSSEYDIPDGAAYLPPMRRAVIGFAVAGVAACVVLLGHFTFVEQPSSKIAATEPPPRPTVTQAPSIAPVVPETRPNQSGSRNYAAQDELAPKKANSNALRKGPDSLLAQASSSTARSAHRTTGIDAGASGADDRAARLAADEARVKWLEQSVALDADVKKKAMAELDMQRQAALEAKGKGDNTDGKPVVMAKADAADTFRKGYEAYLSGHVAEGIGLMEKADAVGAPGARARLCAIYRKPTAAEGKDFLKEANKCKGID